MIALPSLSWPVWLYRFSDPRDAWTGTDKQVHGFGLAWITADFGLWPAVIVAVTVEVVQALLWMSLSPQRRMLIEDGKAPWPFFHDRASLKDLVADAAGIVLARLV